MHLDADVTSTVDLEEAQRLLAVGQQNVGRVLDDDDVVGPSEVVNVKSLAKVAGKGFRAAVIINRVEYSDGTFWQRNGWSVDTLKLRPDSRSKSAATVCRSL